MDKLRPTMDRVLVRPEEIETKTKSGIIIPESSREKPQRGIVVATGEGYKDKPLTVKKGDAVLYGKYSGSNVSLDGVDYLMMREADILGVLTED